ncbi:50S ribosomal protein L22 [Candidatus Kaiserbacteria bacterium RIFCSPLOWO2_01_FULL_53_17]|uniref:Large ribosomal subunit protein uL22 n=1 Tax=Candidatus Kaiserbacteria bacterium RIFCSPLOWO2_01_FULL_53_17 TaxID=1798511 RepID=A0A1F6EI04_9BACT|nr:MAG: 50S ribosomal protein L22 [Candidatus Kaiserbacteria bacterium RIFCSPLOWO2_01_FULL_53_17]
MKASLQNFKQSPRKVRLVADMIRGKRITAARDALVFLPKKSSPEIQKLLDSAVANARSQGFAPEDLIVKTITVDKGAVLRRMKPMARGRGARINRTMSIVKLELDVQQNKEQKTENKKEKTKAEKTPTKSKKKSLTS